MNLFLLCFSLVLQTTITDASLLHKIRNFLTGGKKGKPKTWEFVAGSEVEYPGNNKEKIKVIQEIWGEYYNCLSSHYENLGPYRSITPEALMVFEGTSVQLHCKVCVPPSDTTRTDDVQWNYRTIPPNDTKLVELGEHKFLSPEDKVLHMYDLTIQDTGQYFCQKGLTVTSAYFLEVVNEREPMKEVRSEQSKDGPYPEPSVDMPHVGIQLSTTWSNWSKCSTCGAVGKRIRYGICTVRRSGGHPITNNNTIFQQGSNVKHNSNEYTVLKLNMTSHNTITKESHTDDNKSSMSDDNWNSTAGPVSSAEVKENQAIFNFFSNGIPCRSKILLNSILKIPEVLTRKSEITIELCKEPCPDSTVFQVVDEKGNILESANNSAGIYSTLQGIPPEVPEVQRLTMYENTLTARIALRCPGNLNSDAPIQWQIGSFTIDSATVYILSHGRIFINVLDQIIIMHPQVVDSNIYSCWQDGELAGTIRLIVTKKLELDFNHQVMMISMLLFCTYNPNYDW